MVNIAGVVMALLLSAGLFVAHQFINRQPQAEMSRTVSLILSGERDVSDFYSPGLIEELRWQTGVDSLSDDELFENTLLFISTYSAGQHVVVGINEKEHIWEVNVIAPVNRKVSVRVVRVNGDLIFSNVQGMEEAVLAKYDLWREFLRSGSRL